jgi:hypothetical protein
VYDLLHSQHLYLIRGGMLTGRVCKAFKKNVAAKTNEFTKVSIFEHVKYARKNFTFVLLCKIRGANFFICSEPLFLASLPLGK